MNVEWECGSCGAITDNTVVEVGEMFHLRGVDCRNAAPWAVRLPEGYREAWRERSEIDGARYCEAIRGAREMRRRLIGTWGVTQSRATAWGDERRDGIPAQCDFDAVNRRRGGWGR